MALDSYTGLKASIADYIVDADISDEKIDECIDIVEARNGQELQLSDGRVVAPVRLRDMLTREPITVDARFVDLPTGYLEADELRLLTEPVTILDQVTVDKMTRLRRETSDRPQFFAIHEQIEFDVTPIESFSGEIIYYQALTALSDANDSNALLVKAPNVYLYGALAATAPFLLHDERIPVWEKLYIDGRIGIAGAEKRSRHIGPVISRLRQVVP